LISLTKLSNSCLLVTSDGNVGFIGKFSCNSVILSFNAFSVSSKVPTMPAEPQSKVQPKSLIQSSKTLIKLTKSVSW
jgi:hypothetical protein